MQLAKAGTIAEELKARLGPACQRIEVAGSIRRQRPDVGDIELLCIPSFSDGYDALDREIRHLVDGGILDFRLNKRGSRLYGPQNKLMFHITGSIGVDIFSTDFERWAVAMVVRTGGRSTNIRIATAALKKGYRFQAYGRGFTTPEGEIICRSEREVFEAVGLPYLEPWKRE